MNLPESEHFRTLFKMIVQSCKEQRLAIMGVKHEASGSSHVAIVSVSLEESDEDKFSAEVVPLAILIDPQMGQSLQPIIPFSEDGEWEIEIDDSPIQLDDRNRWRPPTKGLL